MISFFEAVLQNPLLQLALIAGVSASVTSGLVGCYIVIKRIAFIAGSISHAVLGGMGFFLWLNRVHHVTWATPTLGACTAALLSAWLIAIIRVRFKEREDSAIAALWSIGMAIGIIFIAHTPGYNVELMDFLIGNILWVSQADLAILWALNGITLLTLLLLHKRLLSICFDEEYAKLQGLHVEKLYLLLLTLIALSVVLLIQIVGVILVLTLLTLPATIANLFTGRLSRMMMLAVALSCAFNIFGTALSYTLNWPIGATIALLIGTVYVVILLTRKYTPLFKRFKHQA